MAILLTRMMGQVVQLAQGAHKDPLPPTSAEKPRPNDEITRSAKFYGCHHIFNFLFSVFSTLAVLPDNRPLCPLR